VIAERIHFGGDQMSSSLQHARSGALKSMAVMGVARAPELPDVPTVREMGYPNIELRGWNGFFAPARTPESVVTRLHQEIAAAVKHPDVQRRFAEVGAEPVGSTPTELYDVVRDQMDKVRPMVAELKLVVQ
jgi:tripartite-type tricarboxylate transporter receptor subunit TctC